MSTGILLALTGHPGSGKSEHGRYLESVHDFRTVTGSEFLKQEAAKEGIKLSERKDYGDYQRKLRLEHSASFITDMILALPEKNKANIGLRNRFDVIAHKASGGIIIALVCPAEIRFARTAGSDPKYPQNFEEFMTTETLEYDNPDPYGQHTQWAMDQADHCVDTSKPISLVRRAIDEIVSTYSR